MLNELGLRQVIFSGVGHSRVRSQLACGDCHLYGAFHNYALSIMNYAFEELSGGYCGGVPPLPIPNREVKPACADGTAMQCGRVGGRHFSKREALSQQWPGASSFVFLWCLYTSSLPFSMLPLFHSDSLRGSLRPSLWLIQIISIPPKGLFEWLKETIWITQDYLFTFFLYYILYYGDNLPTPGVFYFFLAVAADCTLI